MNNRGIVTFHVKNPYENKELLVKELIAVIKLTLISDYWGKTVFFSFASFQIIFATDLRSIFPSYHCLVFAFVKILPFFGPGSAPDLSLVRY